MKGPTAWLVTSLAGHIIAAHQALCDQSRSQACLLEMVENEEQAATSAAVLLAACNDAKAFMRAEAPDQDKSQKADFLRMRKAWHQRGGSGEGDPVKVRRLSDASWLTSPEFQESLSNRELEQRSNTEQRFNEKL